MTDREDQHLRMAIEYGQHGHTSVRLAGELDIAGTARLRRVLYALLEEPAPVDLDLRELRFVDLPGVRMLVELAAVAARRECPLEMAGAQGQVARVLDLTSASALLPLAAA